MIYGYARVQLNGRRIDTIYREKISGATADRPQLKKLMDKLAAGDVVVIPAVDRLSRDTTDLLVIARKVQRAGAGLRSIAEPVVHRRILPSLCSPCWSSRQARWLG
jgi:DNA invertase Pin-like site-specific DNA recombinase